MTLNADASRGRIRVQLSDSGGVLEGYAYADCQPITSDTATAPVRWQGKSQLPATDRPHQIAFEIRNANLYEFSLTAPASR